jgi:protein involved in polysaccharide export with SLBB domain
MGGGATSNAYLRRVQLVRTVSGKERVIIDVNATSNGAVEVQDGDLVRISSVDSRIYNAVALEGAVRYPGRYELKPGMRLTQLLTREDVLPTAYVDRVEVQRYADDYRTEVTSVNLKQLWAGDVSLDLVLKPLDRVIVRSEVRPPASVTLTGEVKRPGAYPIAPGERLSSVLKRAGGFTDRAFVKGAVFTRESIKKIEEEQLRSFIDAQERRLIADAGTVVVRGLDREEAASSQQLVKTKQELLAALARKVVLGRMVVKLDEPEKLEGIPNDVLLEDGDTLHTPQPPQSVVVLGSVRNPASVLYKEGEGAEYYLNRAGGFSREADQKESYVVKADGSTVSGFTKIRTIEPGDAILVPPKEEVKFRPLGIAKDMLQILSTGLLSVAALAVIF